MLQLTAATTGDGVAALHARRRRYCRHCPIPFAAPPLALDPAVHRPLLAFINIAPLPPAPPEHVRARACRRVATDMRTERAKGAPLLPRAVAVTHVVRFVSPNLTEIPRERLTNDDGMKKTKKMSVTIPRSSSLLSLFVVARCCLLCVSWVMPPLTTNAAPGQCLHLFAAPGSLLLRLLRNASNSTNQPSCPRLFISPNLFGSCRTNEQTAELRRKLAEFTCRGNSEQWNSLGPEPE